MSKNWVNKLSINKWTGVTDLVIGPANPDILYLASWQRHRNVAAHMGGGPGPHCTRVLMVAKHGLKSIMAFRLPTWVNWIGHFTYESKNTLCSNRARSS